MDAARLEHCLSDEYIADLGTMPMDVLRQRRGECQELEVALSYRRRMAQGRLDIVGAERRRRSGADTPDDRDIVERLPQILADRTRAPGLGRLPQLMAPEAGEIDTSDLDAIAGPRRLGTLADVSDDELDELMGLLSAYEADVSQRRRALHERIDVLQAEITRRYRTGEASVESLLQ